MINKSATTFSGKYHFEILRDGTVVDKWDEENLIPTEGLNFILNVLTQAGTTKINNWYMGLGTGNYTVAGTDTAATIASLATETFAYDTSARKEVVWNGASTTASLSNSSSKATFTASSGITVTNVFIVSTTTGGTGKLLSSLKLSVSKALVTGDQLVASFTLTAASA